MHSIQRIFKFFFIKWLRMDKFVISLAWHFPKEGPEHYIENISCACTCTQLPIKHYCGSLKVSKRLRTKTQQDVSSTKKGFTLFLQLTTGGLPHACIPKPRDTHSCSWYLGRNVWRIKSDGKQWSLRAANSYFSVHRVLKETASDIPRSTSN